MILCALTSSAWSVSSIYPRSTAFVAFRALISHFRDSTKAAHNGHVNTKPKAKFKGSGSRRPSNEAIKHRNLLN